MRDKADEQRREAEELAVLDEVAQRAEASAQEHRLLARRLTKLRAGRAQGRSWNELLAGEPAPDTLDLVGRVLKRTTELSGRLRRALAHGLRAEGATLPAIARKFGVSHQRVSALLRRRDDPGLGEA